MNAMILAAGRGARLRPLTDRIPKPLVEVGGVTLLERHLRRLAAAGIETVVINLGWLGEQIAERVGSGQDFGLSVAYSPEFDGILDTGGAIRRALPLLGDDPFWVLNGDVFTDFSPRAAELDDGTDAHLVLIETPEYRPNGDFGLVDDRVSNHAPPLHTFSGIACYRPGFFRAESVRPFSVVPLLRAAADQGRMSGELYAGEWADIGTPERLQSLNARVRSRSASEER